MKRHGITLEDFNRMSQEQDGKCSTCRQEAKLYVDHCHETKRVRGLLCSHCNSVLGLVRESEDTLLNCIRYLDQHCEQDYCI